MKRGVACFKEEEKSQMGSSYSPIGQHFDSVRVCKKDQFLAVREVRPNLTSCLVIIQIFSKKLKGQQF
jgi:hypothetical protein